MLERYERSPSNAHTLLRGRPATVGAARWEAISIHREDEMTGESRLPPAGVDDHVGEAHYRGAGLATLSISNVSVVVAG
jgi:hypothetical protein